MDHTQVLPDDVLADILRRLSARDLAASRCVHKAWLDVVDAHGLLLPHVLPHSVHGIFLNYNVIHRPRLFARPSVQPVHGNLSFLPNYRDGFPTILDHCNGLMLYKDSCRTMLSVVNPATRRWENVSWEDVQYVDPRLVFDPVASRHYEVLSIPQVPCKRVLNSPVSSSPMPGIVESSSKQYEQKSDFSMSSKSPPIESRGEQEDSHDSMEWPPSLWTLNVFSSSTGQWQTRLFVREGETTGTMTIVRVDSWEEPSCGGSWEQLWEPRWRYSAYWQGSLYLHCNDKFVVRLSLSDCKYQVIKAPIDTEKIKHSKFLGKSEKGVYLATWLHGSYHLQVWILTESRGRTDWVLKHHVDLESCAMVCLRDLQDFGKTWTIAHDDDVLYYQDKEEDEEKEVDGQEEELEEKDDDKEEQGAQKQNNEMVTSEDREWNSDDDNVLNIEDGHDTGYNNIAFLGFHPYKEVVFLRLNLLVGVAYHLKSSKVQYLGEMCTKDDYNSTPIHIYEAFPYTPCMIGELLKHASEGPRMY